MSEALKIDPREQGPAIYVACLASYNAGELYGRWISASQRGPEIYEEIRAMLKGSKHQPAEDWAIHDYEGFGEISLDEHTHFDTVAELAACLELHGDAFGVWYSYHDGSFYDLEEMKDKFEEQYNGEWKSPEDFAVSLLDETGELQSIPENLRYYFDYEKYARDLEIGGDYSFVRKGKICYAFARF